MMSLVKTDEYSVGQILEVVPGVLHWEGTALRITHIYPDGVTGNHECTAPLAGCTCASFVGEPMHSFFQAHEVRPIQASPTCMYGRTTARCVCGNTVKLTRDGVWRHSTGDIHCSD